ncbi:MAG: methionyl-tRNA formyltransferase [Acidimicrobiia bacterium]
MTETPARLVFLGTPEAAIPSLRRLATGFRIDLVVTRPDRPRGRSGRPVAPPVKREAESMGLTVAQPERGAELAERLRRVGPLDLAVVVAFGMLIRPEVLSMPRRGCLNLHFSLLPRWRGAAPVAHAILAGDTVTGATVIRLDEGLDTGPVLGVRTTSIAPDDTAGSVTERLALRGADLLADLARGWLAGTVAAVPQPAEGLAAPKLSPFDGRLDWHLPVAELDRRIRAFSPHPGAFSTVDGDRLGILAAHPGPGRLASGSLRLAGGELLCGTSTGTLVLDVVHPAGRRPMSGGDWARGRRGQLPTLA